jgi:hypothetical protein
MVFQTFKMRIEATERVRQAFLSEIHLGLYSFCLASQSYLVQFVQRNEGISAEYRRQSHDLAEMATDRH